jgi:hypothetical protein
LEHKVTLHPVTRSDVRPQRVPQGGEEKEEEEEEEEERRRRRRRRKRDSMK